ncbi:MAG: VPLPA-CTERM sorting domain-containing protein [Pseudomonadota bacterium]
MKKIALLAVLGFLFPSISSAATIGVAVVDDQNPTEVTGQPEASASEANALVGLANSFGSGADASDIVGYFIPLNDDCTFGDGDCGLEADRGLGGSLTMWLYFAGVEAGKQTANFFFEDLDLIGGNDPLGFFETVELFDSENQSVVVVDDLDGDYGDIVDVGGNSDTQRAISLDLGYLDAGNYFLKLGMTSDVTLDFFGGNRDKKRDCKKYLKGHSHKYWKCPKNTPEFLIATIETTPVPLPAAGGMLAVAVGGFAMMRRRRKTD